MPLETFSVAPAPEDTDAPPLPPPPTRSDLTEGEASPEPLPAALGSAARMRVSLRRDLAPSDSAPPSEEIQDAAELPWANEASLEKGRVGGVFGGEGVGAETGQELHPRPPEVATGAALVHSTEQVPVSTYAGGSTSLKDKDPEVCLVKDSFGEVRMVRPVPNYAKIDGQSFESEAGAAGAARNYGRQKSSMAVTVQDVDLSTGFDVPAKSSDSNVGSISAAISAALAKGVGWGAPRVEEAESTMMAKGFASSSVPPHPL